MSAFPTLFLNTMLIKISVALSLQFLGGEKGMGSLNSTIVLGKIDGTFFFPTNPNMHWDLGSHTTSDPVGAGY